MYNKGVFRSFMSTPLHFNEHIMSLVFIYNHFESTVSVQRSCRDCLSYWRLWKNLRVLHWVKNYLNRTHVQNVRKGLLWIYGHGFCWSRRVAGWFSGRVF